MEYLYKRIIRDIILGVNQSVETCSADLDINPNTEIYHLGKLKQAQETQSMVQNVIEFYEKVYAQEK